MNNQVYGYARVSTKSQELQRQIDNISELYPNAKIYCDKYTGKTMNRPEWNRLLKVVESGDTIIFDEVSRMSRNAEEGYKQYQEFYHNGINLKFIKEPQIDTSVYRDTMQVAMSGNEIADVYLEATNKVLWLLAERQIKVAFRGAQQEIDLRGSRTREGMRKKGLPNVKDETGKIIKQGKLSKIRTGKRYETKKAKECKAVILKHSKYFNGTLKDIEVIRLLKLSRNSYYKYKRELLSEQA